SGGAGGGAGTNFLSGLVGSLTSGMSAASSSIQGIFQAGLSLIPVIGPILSQFAGPLFEGIKAIGGKILGIFSGLFKSTASFRTERAAGIFGAFQVPQAVLDSIGQMSAQFSKAGRALPDTIASLVGFDDVIKAVGITDMPQFMFAMGKGDEAVQRLKEGLITGAEAADFFGNESLRIMKEAAIELGGTAVAEFEKMIAKAVEAGIVIPAEFTAAAAAAADAITSTTQKAADATEQTAIKLGDVVTIQIPKLFGDGMREITVIANQAIVDASEKAKSAAESAAASISTVTDTAVRNASRLRDTLNDTLGNLRFEIPVGFNVDKFSGLVSGAGDAVPQLAHGGIVTQPTVALIGEAGPEAVVPLTGRGGGGGGSIDLTISAEGIGLLARKTVELTPEILREFGIG
ncbi:hypothetical protein LCGC14_2407750, partial [marine sediment metagenome]